MCTNPFNTPDEENKWRNLYSHPNVRLINRVETQEEVYNIMSKVDCGVFPSRGEGWNLEALELMSCGKHVIITDYSAHTEFCTKDNSNLVTITDTEPAFDGKWFFGQGNWAKISEDQVSELQGYMESFHTSKKILNESGIDTAKKFSWRNTATKIIDLI
jgi:glycosyltransferase involved in cell wall biosynthesis